MAVSRWRGTITGVMPFTSTEENVIAFTTPVAAFVTGAFKIKINGKKLLNSIGKPYNEKCIYTCCILSIVLSTN
jgi:hypothetical protein